LRTNYGDHVPSDFAALFAAIAETGSLAAAARRSNISPSMASRRLAQIESELGVRLVNRTTRSLVLTEAGRLYLRWAEDAVQREAALKDGLEALRSVPRGRVRVAMDAWVASSYLPDVLRRFSADHPEITLDVLASDYPPGELDGDCDLAVHAGLSPRDDLVGRRAYDYRRFVCAAPSYIERRGVPRTPADLRQHSCLVHRSAVESVWKFRSKAGVETEFRAEAYVQTNSWLLLRTMAIEGLGVAHLGGPLPTEDIRSGLLVRLLPEFESIPIGNTKLGVWVIHANAHPPRRVELFARFITRFLRATVSSRELLTKEQFDKLSRTAAPAPQPARKDRRRRAR
jgi:LysR family transcriptional activator of dmlA